MPLFLVLPALAAPRMVQSFSGDYTGNKDEGTVKISLKQASDGSVTGTFNDGSSTANLTGTATKDGQKITGQLNYQGINLAVEIRRKGNQIEFVMKFGTEEEVITLSRTGAGAPAETPPPTPKQAPATPKQAPALPSKPSRFVGVFKGAELTLILTSAGEGKLLGTITLGDKKFPATAKQVPQGIEGTFQADGESFAFLAKFEGDLLLLNSGGTTHMLTPQDGAKPANPLATKPTAKPKPTNPLTTKTKPSPGNVATATGSGFTHPAGLSLNLPQGWKVQQTGILTALLPPGATKLDGDELYLLLVGEANGIQSKSDPRLAQVLMVLLNGPKGEGGMLLGPGVVFQQTGSENGGLTFSGANGRLHARCLFSDPKGRIAAVLAIGLKSKITPRESALQSAMASVSERAPEHDNRLLGSWKGTTKTKSLDARDAVGRLKASSVSDSSTTYQLTGDGRFVESRHSRTIALGPGGVSLDSGDTVERTAGQWAASNGKIAFSDDNGLYLLGTYQIQGGQVIIQIADRIITLGRG